MTVVLPLVKEGGKRVAVRPDEGDPGLLDQYRKASTATRRPPIHVCTNKKPSWNKNLGAYTLNFNGRVTEASVKNFQMQLEPEGESGIGGEGARVVLQFGKIHEDVFTMDFQWPFSALQAFAVCLSSFDSKLACE